MDDYESLSHGKWVCQYHVRFIQTCRRQTLYRQLGGLQILFHAFNAIADRPFNQFCH